MGVFWVGDGEARLARSVSWIPGAEGAPLEDGGFDEDAKRFEVEEGCDDEGVIRSDYNVISVDA